MAESNNQFNKAIDEGLLKLEELRKQIQGVNKEFKGLNDKGIEQLARDIAKLVKSLKGLNDAKLSAEHVTGLVNSLTKLTNTKFDTSNLKEVTSCIKSLNRELKTLKSLGDISIPSLPKNAGQGGYRTRHTDIEYRHQLLSDAKSKGKLGSKGLKDYYDNYEKLLHNKLSHENDELVRNDINKELFNIQQERVETLKKQAELEKLEKDKTEKLLRAQASSEVADYRHQKAKEREAEDREENIPVVSAKRKAIEQRGLDTRAFGVQLADGRLVQTANQSPYHRVLSRLSGGKEDIISDIISATGLTESSITSIGRLKAENNSIIANRNDKISKQNQKEASAIAVTNSMNMSPEAKAKRIDKISKWYSKKRQSINTESSAQILANEQKIAEQTQIMNANLLKAAVAITAFTKTMKAIIKVTKEASTSQQQLISNLQSMGASSNSLNLDTIKYYTNELNNISARWKNIKNTVGDFFMESMSGWLWMIDNVLEGIDALGNLSEKLIDIVAKSPIGKFALPALSQTSKGNNSKELDINSINKSSVKMLKFVEDLEGGITKNGVEVVVDRETSSNALNSVFSSANSLGIDNTSAGNISAKLSDMALDIVTKHGGDYGSVMKALQDSIFNGSNAAAQYGLNVDDQTLTGWAAKEKGLDLANVQYTDAYKAALRFELAQQELLAGNSDAMTDQIKKWKQLGDVIQTASGTLFDFQEVQSIQAKDFTIPEVDGKGNVYESISGTTDEQLDKVDELNKKVKKTGELYVMTADGAKTLADAYEYIGGDLSQLCLLYDELNGRYVLATDDYLPSLTQAERDLFTVVNDNGLLSLAMYCDWLGLSQDETLGLATQAGMAQSAIKDLNLAIQGLESFNIDYSDLNEAYDAAMRLQNVLYQNELSKYSTPVQGYVNNGYKFSDGETIDDMNLGDWLFNSEKRAAFNDFVSIGAGWTEYGHKDGGISTKAHVANISEGNTREAIIPLDSGAGINTLGEAMKLALGGNSAGINIENLNINNEGINIAENENQWRQVGNRIYEEISTIQRERGDMNYGILHNT